MCIFGGGGPAPQQPQQDPGPMPDDVPVENLAPTSAKSKPTTQAAPRTTNSGTGLSIPTG